MSLATISISPPSPFLATSPEPMIPLCHSTNPLIANTKQAAIPASQFNITGIELVVWNGVFSIREPELDALLADWD